MRVSWRKLYESCVSETNPNKLRKLVFELEDAIVLRYHDLACEPSVPDGLSVPKGPKESAESQALRRAAERLLQLKIEKLGWPRRSSPAVAASPALMPVSVPASIDEVKEPITLRKNWRTVVTRTQAALLVVERAWQNWIFKSLK
jgi:hypothetical protein